MLHPESSRIDSPDAKPVGPRALAAHEPPAHSTPGRDRVRADSSTWRGSGCRGAQPSGCSFWRLAADGRTFFTAPEDHYNCPIGSYTHDIPLPPGREHELGETLKLMGDIGYIRMEEVPRFPAPDHAGGRPSTRRWPIRRSSPTRCSCVGSLAGSCCCTRRRPGRASRRAPARAANLHGRARGGGGRAGVEPGLHRQPRVYRAFGGRALRDDCRRRISGAVVEAWRRLPPQTPHSPRITRPAGRSWRRRNP